MLLELARPNAHVNFAYAIHVHASCNKNLSDLSDWDMYFVQRMHLYPSALHFFSVPEIMSEDEDCFSSSESGDTSMNEVCLYYIVCICVRESRFLFLCRYLKKVTNCGALNPVKKMSLNQMLLQKDLTGLTLHGSWSTSSSSGNHFIESQMQLSLCC